MSECMEMRKWGCLIWKRGCDCLNFDSKAQAVCDLDDFYESLTGETASLPLALLTERLKDLKTDRDRERQKERKRRDGF
jgi:hypothetical protein